MFKLILALLGLSTTIAGFYYDSPFLLSLLSVMSGSALFTYFFILFLEEYMFKASSFNEFWESNKALLKGKSQYEISKYSFFKGDI